MLSNPSLLPPIPEPWDCENPALQTFPSPFSKGLTEKTFETRVEETTGEIRGKDHLCTRAPTVSQVLSHVNFPSLEGRDPHALMTNEEMEAQRGAITSWEVAHPGFKMRTFLSLSS